MAVSTIGVADADTPDKYLHTHQRTISSTAREDQYIQQGEGAYPTYNAMAGLTSVATTNDHVIQVMGDGSNYSRIKRITIYPYTVTAASRLRLTLLRLTSAGTGGSSVTPAPFDTSDTYGGGAMTLPTSKGSESTALLFFNMFVPASGTAQTSPVVWTPDPSMKPIIFGTSTANGVALKVYSGIAGGQIDVNIEFITTTYL